jgi:hypothetical protein
MLSLKCVTSTALSDAQPHNKDQTEAPFRKIGAGACGAIFAQNGKSLVYKLAKATDLALWNDYQMHSRLEHSFREHQIHEIKIPQCYFFVPDTEDEWFSKHQGLTKAAADVCNLPTAVLVTERIPPLHQSTRKLLIEKYCSPRNKDSALADLANKNCLVRLYLGSSQGKSGQMFFSLRNFKLHLNQMVEIQLDVEKLARTMAIALATMHWAAQIDARDVEFVLGSSTELTPLRWDLSAIEKLETEIYTGPPSYVDHDFFTRVTEFWVLDFNQVRTITKDETGIAQAIQAAQINDPYIPKPLQESAVERKVWNAFVRAYLDQSRIILEGEGEAPEVLALPGKFLLGLVEAQRKKQLGKWHS